MFMMKNEKAIEIGDGGTALEAWFAHVGDQCAVVAAPHPMMGGRMDNPVVEALVRGFQAGGMSTLRFNFRGVGLSGGRASSDVADAVADYRRAVTWLRATQRFSWLTFAGYSFGAVAAIETFLSGLDCHCVAAVAPPSATITPEKMEKLDALFALLYGDQDQLIDRYEWMHLSTYVPQGHLSVLPGADHFLAGQESAIADYARELGDLLYRAQRDPAPELDMDDTHDE